MDWWEPTATGSYSVTLTDSNGCSATSAPFAYTFIGIDNGQATWLDVYPNPVAQGEGVTFRLRQSGSFRLKLYNGLGQLVLDRPLDGANGCIHGAACSWCVPLRRHRRRNGGCGGTGGAVT
ncbi:MAG: hypothetical protein IPP17_25920 [Bacteroidetes bacterium]|nr:hypothetical protein [Bacteroidota bacterium]